MFSVRFVPNNEYIRVETGTVTKYRSVLSSERAPRMDRAANDKPELISDS
jgi:hypothetical protein